MSAEPAPRTKVLWIARLEYRFHAWRERRARARGNRASIAAYPGYGSEEWVRVLGRVLIVPPLPTTRRIFRAGSATAEAQKPRVRRNGKNRIIIAKIKSLHADVAEPTHQGKKAGR